MQRINSFHAINIFTLEAEKWEYKIHKHNFYELIFVEKGSGEHLLNDVSYSFKRGDVFLLTPNDAHEFIINEKIKFIYLKFTEQIFLEKLNTNKKTYWEESLRNILIKFIHSNDSNVVCCEEDKAHILCLLNIMLYEYNNKKALFNNEVVLELFGSIMSIVTRNLNQNRISNKSFDKNTERINAILTYIRINAINNQKMDIRKMAEYFLMSPNYISIFVKKHSGLSIQQHIIQSKIKLAEKLLKQNRFTINEISDKLGFTDASHFNKIFKKYKSINPSEFLNNL